MQFHIAQTKIFLKTPSFPIQGVPMNNLAPMKNCPGGMQGNLNWMPGYGHGLSKVNHYRIRLGLSHLNSHLHHYNLIDSPSCSNPECGRTPESAAHYFLSCPRYNNERRVLFVSLSRKLFPNVNYNTFIVLMPDHICTILLEGSEDASYEENTSIFDEVQIYRLNTAV